MDIQEHLPPIVISAYTESRPVAQDAFGFIWETFTELDIVAKVTVLAILFFAVDACFDFAMSKKIQASLATDVPPTPEQTRAFWEDFDKANDRTPEPLLAYAATKQHERHPGLRWDRLNICGYGSYIWECLTKKTTTGDGTCALHALLGTPNSSGVYNYKGSGSAARESFVAKLRESIDQEAVNKAYVEAIQCLIAADEQRNPSHLHRRCAAIFKSKLRDSTLISTYKESRSQILSRALPGDFFQELYDKRADLPDVVVEEIAKDLSRTNSITLDAAKHLVRTDLDLATFSELMINALNKCVEKAKHGADTTIDWDQLQKGYNDFRGEKEAEADRLLTGFANNDIIKEAFYQSILDTQFWLDDKDLEIAALCFGNIRLHIIDKSGVHPPVGEGEDVYVHSSGCHYSRCLPTQAMQEHLSDARPRSDSDSSEGSEGPGGSEHESPGISPRSKAYGLEFDEPLPITQFQEQFSDITMNVETFGQLLNVSEASPIEIIDTYGDGTCALHALWGTMHEEHQNLRYPRGSIAARVKLQMDLRPYLDKPYDSTCLIQKHYIDDLRTWFSTYSSGGGDGSEFLAVTGSMQLGTATQQSVESENLAECRRIDKAVSELFYMKREHLPEFVLQQMSDEDDFDRFIAALNEEGGRDLFHRRFNGYRDAILDARGAFLDTNDVKWSEIFSEVDAISEVIETFKETVEQDFIDFALNERTVEKYLMHCIGKTGLHLTTDQIKIAALVAKQHIILVEQMGDQYLVTEAGADHPNKVLVHSDGRHYSRAKLSEQFLQTLAGTA